MASVLPRLQLRRAFAAADGAEDGEVRQLPARLDAPEHEPAAAHVATADELRGEVKAAANYLQQNINIFPGGDAAEQDDVAAASRPVQVVAWQRADYQTLPAPSDFWLPIFSRLARVVVECGARLRRKLAFPPELYN